MHEYSHALSSFHGRTQFAELYRFHGTLSLFISWGRTEQHDPTNFLELAFRLRAEARNSSVRACAIIYKFEQAGINITHPQIP